MRGQPLNRFALPFSRYFLYVLAGVLSLTKSNDNSRVYVDGVKVADLNMGIMGRDPWDITGAIVLTRGLHRIEV